VPINPILTLGKVCQMLWNFSPSIVLFSTKKTGYNLGVAWYPSRTYAPYQRPL